jgi:hypothetical protein
MPLIKHDVALDVARPIAEVFAFLDDTVNTPKWVHFCVELKKVTPGPSAVGQKLRYAYKRGFASGLMDGEITGYEKDRALAYRYTDKTMDVAVGFALASAGGGTRLDHWVEITPRNFLGRLMSPIILAATKRQMATDTATLKQILEGARA